MPLCTDCTALPSAWLLPRIAFLHNPTPTSTSASASTTSTPPVPLNYTLKLSWTHLQRSALSCDLCNLILLEAYEDVVTLRYQRSERGKDKPTEVYLQVYPQAVEVICLAAGRVASLRVVLDDESYENATEETRKMFNGRMVSRQAGDERYIKTINNWLSECQTTHSTCQQWASHFHLPSSPVSSSPSTSPNATRHLPTRIIDVRPTSKDPTSESVHLHHPDPTDTSPYLALSYRWGSPPSTSSSSSSPSPPASSYPTTKSTLTAHKCSIPLSTLPKTIREAIHLTRQLGIAYLWVDALCIIQDDVADWTVEVARMHTVYGRAFMSIAAAVGEGCDDGLWCGRSDWYGSCVKLTSEYDDSNDWMKKYSGLKEVTGLGLCVVPSFKKFGGVEKKNSLDDRAWTFQEQVLAGRTLVIGSGYTSFKCKQEHYDETGFGPVPSSDYTGSVIRKAVTRASPASPAPPPSQPQPPENRLGTTSILDDNSKLLLETHSGWHSVLTSYTTRHLTHQSDILPAIASTATVFAQGGLLGRYLCGLWETNIHRHLLWQPDRSSQTPSAQHRRSDTTSAYLAPSWSWASVTGPMINSAIERAFRSDPKRGIASMMLDELGHDQLLEDPVGAGGSTGGSGVAADLLIIQSIDITNKQPGDVFGSVVSAELRVQAVLMQVVLGRRIRDSIIGLKSVKNGEDEDVGFCIWDEDEDDSMQRGGRGFWVCPVLRWKAIEENGARMCECLVLKEVTTSASEEGKGRFMRVAKGSCLIWWDRSLEAKQFVLV